MPEDRQMPILKWCAVAVSVLWIAAAGWGELSKMALPDDFRSYSNKRVAERCGGSFSSRYECKSSIIIGNDNSAFYDWSLRLAIVFVPPALLALLYSRVQKRRERQAEEERERRAIAQLKRMRAEQAELRRQHDEARLAAQAATRQAAQQIIGKAIKRRPA
jgi:hypothetical protein